MTLSKVRLPLPGKPFAGYLLLAKRLAPGGLGVVFRASGEILRGDVAHKLPETNPLIDNCCPCKHPEGDTRRVPDDAP